MGRADDNLQFSAIEARDAAPTWKILIADDEPEVHDVTRLVLGSFRFADRKLEFLSAHSANEARRVLEQHPDVAVLLLDVVVVLDEKLESLLIDSGAGSMVPSVAS